ncbi:MAG: 1-acyl-sn-glycerol-3-phosphate acyltransferase [Lachnospiraceae bacterium]|nr:1-acyl-sn-glycerol-3-phosphate acyltransferase [Lachnospiraceae bacterium]
MRIALMVVRLFFQVPYMFFRIRRYGLYEDKFLHFEEAFAYIKKAVTKANHAGRVIVKAYGTENLPDKNGFIMFCNHQGLFDTLVFLESCPKPFAFLAKKEVRNTILLKQTIAALGSLTMDREDLRQSLKVINQITDEVKRGKNFLIFPEGTRSPEPNVMIDFKGGSFKSATKAKCPIVPCALVDSHKPFDENSIKPVTVKLRYLPPLYYDEYKDMKTVQIAEAVKARIETAIAELIKT